MDVIIKSSNLTFSVHKLLLNILIYSIHLFGLETCRIKKIYIIMLYILISLDQIV